MTLEQYRDLEYVAQIAIRLEPVWKGSQIVWEVTRCSECGAKVGYKDNYCRDCGRHFTGRIDMKAADRLALMGEKTESAE